ncbi:MAG: DNA repair exonuclease [Lachnospiraceae bacterium]|jgi:exonuclease SbcD|nr:DNA repair exonuclease [Lachnospiraceae bacterium]
MKFMHTADIHLGCQPDRGFPWSKERSLDILSAFRDFINACQQEEPDLVLISGDLFHRQPAPVELKEVNSLFSGIPDIPVVLIAGNHDCVRPGSSLAEFSWAPNVTFLSDSKPETVSFPKIKTVVHGFSYHSREIKEPLYDSLTAPKDENFHILLAHGGDETHIPIDKKKLSASGFSYTALGHIHKPEFSEAGRYGFPGSLSPLDLTETGAHGYLAGELKREDGKESLKLGFVPLSSRSYIPCQVKVTDRTTNQSLFQTLEKFMKQYGVSNMYKVTLSGKRDPDLVFHKDYLCSAGRIISFRDDTIPSYDIEQLLNSHRNDIIGDYIAALLPDGTEKEFSDPLRRHAFYYGLDALLSNFDIDTGES